jgi:hypothetical protein
MIAATVHKGIYVGYRRDDGHERSASRAAHMIASLRSGRTFLGGFRLDEFDEATGPGYQTIRHPSTTWRYVFFAQTLSAFNRLA